MLGTKGKVMNRIWLLQTIASGMLLWALYPDNPYGYYVLLRWVCCGIFAYLAFCTAVQKKKGWLWMFGIMAIVYNPIIPIHLTRDIWQVLNIVTIGIAVASIFFIKGESAESESVPNKADAGRIKLMPPRRKWAGMSFSDRILAGLMVFGWILAGFGIIYTVKKIIFKEW